MNWDFIYPAVFALICGGVVVGIEIKHGISWRLIVLLSPWLLFGGWVIGVLSCEWKTATLRNNSSIELPVESDLEPRFPSVPPFQLAALSEWPGAVDRGEHLPVLRKIPPDGRYAFVSVQHRPYDMTIYCPLFQLDDAEGNYDRARTMPSDLGMLPVRCDYLLLWHDERQVWEAPGRM